MSIALPSTSQIEKTVLPNGLRIVTERIANFLVELSAAPIDEFFPFVEE